MLRTRYELGGTENYVVTRQFRGKKTGLATLCLGGGNAVALAVERVG